MTADSLAAQTRKTLAALARKRRIAGWHAMRKDELIQVLAKPGSRTGAGIKAVAIEPRRASHGSHSRVPGSPADQLFAVAQSPHWVHLRWTLSPQIVARARAALKAEWHDAAPIIRVFEISAEEGSATSRTAVRDVEIRGNVDHWYVSVENAACTVRFAIGYRASSGKFFAMARSRSVQMLRPDQRSPAETSNGWTHLSATGRSGGLIPAERFQDVRLRVDAELVLHGSARPGASVTCMGRRVELAEDGTFLIRIPLPNGRQVIPAVATLPGGAEERTVVVAVERNTKELEPRNLNEPPF